MILSLELYQDRAALRKATAAQFSFCFLLLVFWVHSLSLCSSHFSDIDFVSGVCGRAKAQQSHVCSTSGVPSRMHTPLSVVSNHRFVLEESSAPSLLLNLRHGLTEAALF